MNFLGKMLLMMISKVTKTSASSSIWKIQFWKILQRGAGYRRGGGAGGRRGGGGQTDFPQSLFRVKVGKCFFLM